MPRVVENVAVTKSHFRIYTVDYGVYKFLLVFDCKYASIL